MSEAPLVLSGTVTAPASEYRLVVMREAAASPHRGIPLEGRYGSVLKFGENPAPLWGAPLPSGAVTVELVRADLIRARRRRTGPCSLVLLGFKNAQIPLDGSRTLDGTWTLGGRAWEIAAAWPVSNDPGPALEAWAYRLPGGDVLLLVTTPEALDTITAAYADTLNPPTGTPPGPPLSQTLSWGGLSDPLTGYRVLYGVLPRDSYALEVRASQGAEQTVIPVPIPEAVPQPPRDPVRWNLPPWLPPTGWTGTLLEAIEHGLPDTRGAGFQLDPRTAQGAALDKHAEFQGLRRPNGERDDLLRSRVLAVLRGRYLSQPGLGAHLSEYSGSPMRVYDVMSALPLLRQLDGSWTLDGSIPLGGDAGGLIWRFRIAVRNPRVPLAWLRAEVERLRPLGSVPEIIQEIPRFPPLLPVAPVRQVMSLGTRRATVALSDGYGG